jgi:hypothetical protein
MWNNVKALSEQKLKTLVKNEKPFEIIVVTDDNLVVENSKKQSRPIQRKQIEDSWQHLLKNGELKRFDVENHYSPRNSAYVVAIIAQLSNVQVTKKPITLHLGANY